ncbi:MAG: hypothetical protein R3F43_06085 [bacterium]
MASCNGAAAPDAWAGAFDVGTGVVSASCLSGLHALGLAARALPRVGEVVVLAADVLSPTSHAHFEAMRVVDADARPFAPGNPGFIPGEAAVALRVAAEPRACRWSGPFLGTNPSELLRKVEVSTPTFWGQGSGPERLDAEELALAGAPAPPLWAHGHTLGASGPWPSRAPGRARRSCSTGPSPAPGAWSASAWRRRRRAPPWPGDPRPPRQRCTTRAAPALGAGRRPSPRGAAPWLVVQLEAPSSRPSRRSWAVACCRARPARSPRASPPPCSRPRGTTGAGHGGGGRASGSAGRRPRRGPRRRPGAGRHHLGLRAHPRRARAADPRRRGVLVAGTGCAMLGPP